MNIQKVAIETIKPYWRNPRKNEKAIQAVRDSIKKYGYVQPILVDKDFVIIAGHTRYSALVSLGWTECDVVVADMSEKKAKEFRIVDNKTGELADWDFSKLFQELGEIGEQSIIGFTDAELEKIIGSPVKIADVSNADIIKAEQEIATRFASHPDSHEMIHVYQGNQEDSSEWGDLEDGEEGGDEEEFESPERAFNSPEKEFNPPDYKDLLIEFACPHCGQTIKMYYGDLIGQFKSKLRE